MDQRIIAIIDGNSLINRAYYAMQRPMITKEGLYTQGVYGFINMLEKLIRDHEPSHMAVAFDRKAPTFRHEEYKDYKAGRKKMPMELAQQLPLLKEVLSAMNIATLELDGYEADDIIGTLAKKGEAEGYQPLIVTGDRDELQLASERTRVIITKKGISEFEELDREGMIAKYGFPPEQFIDYKGLMGDSSDNIPGVPGVGEKTASALILEYGTIENLYDHLEEVSKENLRKKLEENRTLAFMSKRLATIDTNVPLEMDLAEFTLEEPDLDKLVDCYKKLEFNSFLKKIKGNIPSAQKASNGPAEKVDIWTLISPADLDAFMKKVKNSSQWAITVFSDHNHKKRPETQGIFCLCQGIGCYVVHQEDMISLFFQKMNESRCGWVGHQLQNDWYSLECILEETPGVIDFDTAIAAYVVDPSRSNYHINTLLLDFLGETVPSLEEYFAEGTQLNLFEDVHDKYREYGLLWCRQVLALKNVLEKEVEKAEATEVFYQIEMPLVPVLASMEWEGFPVDPQVLIQLGTEIEDKLEGMTETIHGLAGMEFNINSPQQLSQVLFEKLGLPHGKKTTRGYSTGADVLEALMEKHPIIPFVLEYRTFSKIKSTYVDGLLPLIHEDGKIHAHFQQTVAATGRISCTEPNLQNIPIRQELGRRIRKAFVAGNGYLLMGADYRQIELRILAHLAGDETMLDGFRRGEDIHRITAAKVLGVPEDDITPEQRSRAKAVNFGVIYGMSGFGLSEELGISRMEAERYIQQYFDKYHTVKDFLDRLVREGKEQGYSTTIFNRKRPLPEITASNYIVRQMGERLAMNSPIQGSAADIIKKAMIEVYQRLRQEGLGSKLILQVHDELILRVVQGEEERVKGLLCECMESAVVLKVPLAVDFHQGDDWYELK